MTSFWVPGRIEVLGKHTDYAGGRSLLCAIDRGFSARSTPRRDHVVRVIDEGRGEEFTTALSSAATAPPGLWGSYVATVARRLARDFPEARRGADITLRSTLPADAGLSSSSALVVTVALALIDANGLAASPEYQRALPAKTDLAGYLGAVENGWPFGSFGGDKGVGTFGGSEDHTAILCCRAGTLSQFSYAPVRHEQDVTLDPALTFVIGVSGVTANKTGGALDQYNRLSVATATLLAIWNTGTKRNDLTLAAAIDSAPDAANTLRSLVEASTDKQFTSHDLRLRLDQFVEESVVSVPSAVSAFQEPDPRKLGEIVDRSHQMAETHLKNQMLETTTLQRTARELGAIAASAFGAGFGGSVWALVASDNAAEFMQRWQAAYAARHPQPAARSLFFATNPADAAKATTD